MFSCTISTVIGACRIQFQAKTLANFKHDGFNESITDSCDKFSGLADVERCGYFDLFLVYGQWSDLGLYSLIDQEYQSGGQSKREQHDGANVKMINSIIYVNLNM